MVKRTTYLGVEKIEITFTKEEVVEALAKAASLYLYPSHRILCYDLEEGETITIQQRVEGERFDNG